MPQMPAAKAAASSRLSLIASFLTGYIGRMKNGMAEETAICESLEEAAAFAAGICGMEGAFGYGKKYE